MLGWSQAFEAFGETMLQEIKGMSGGEGEWDSRSL